jgi:hypothetical protein
MHNQNVTMKIGFGFSHTPKSKYYHSQVWTNAIPTHPSTPYKDQKQNFLDQKKTIMHLSSHFPFAQVTSKIRALTTIVCYPISDLIPHKALHPPFCMQVPMKY